MSTKMAETFVQKQLDDINIKVRPNVGPGLWLIFLLPLSLLLCFLKQPEVSSQVYKCLAILSVGLLGMATIFLLKILSKSDFTTVKFIHLLPALTTALLFYFHLQKGPIFSVLSGLVATIGYHKSYFFVLKAFPLNFTLGEAAIAAQSLVIFLYSSSITIFNAYYAVPTKVLHIETLIIQVGLICIGSICLLTYQFEKLRQVSQFYVTTGSVIGVLIFAVLHILLKRSALIWIIEFMFSDIAKIKMLTYWVICTALTIVAINSQIKSSKKATSFNRKIFHLLAVLVYFPGLIYQCSLLYLASGITFGVFLTLELLRILNIPPLGVHLRDGFNIFKDEKDIGMVALTPIYLLTACSLPIWIHPAPCDVVDSAGFNLMPLMSGLFIVGIGDAAASVVGALIGKHCWPGTKKTIEGTLASILSQFLVIFVIIYIDVVITKRYHLIITVVAVVIGSITEALTDQIDNLVLPLVMFILLI